MKNFCLVLILCAVSVAAHAADPDMTGVIVDEFGQPMKDPTMQQGLEDKTCKDCPTLTVGHAISHALNSAYGDEQVSIGQKRARSLLAERVWEAKAALLDADEIAVIKRSVGKLWGPIVVRQIVPLVDPNDVPEKVKP